MKRCEADRDYSLVDVNAGVTYYGVWQANRDFWLTYGGDPRYLGGSVFRAPRWMQDLVAYRGWLARGWQPWTCARRHGFVTAGAVFWSGEIATVTISREAR